jgi:hypothetical protein
MFPVYADERDVKPRLPVEGADRVNRARSAGPIRGPRVTAS